MRRRPHRLQGDAESEVLRIAQGLEPLCRKEDQLLALVTDGAWDLGVPRFGLDEIEALATSLVEQYLEAPLKPA